MITNNTGSSRTSTNNSIYILHQVITYNPTVKKLFFHVFRDTSYKVRRKFEKTAFLRWSARNPAISVRKQCFFHVFRNTLYKIRQNKIKNGVFWAFCTKSRKKNCEKQTFLRFSRHFVQSLPKMQKNSVFWAFCATFCRKVLENSVFFTSFETLSTKVVKKMRKTAFVWDFCTTFGKKCEKTGFSRF